MIAQARHLSLTGEALRRLFARLDGADAVLAAVSGGPDSIALMHMLARWGADTECPVLVATVDHGLRAEAADEARRVAEQAAGLGLPHEVLAWTGAKPRFGLQEAARDARYRLLTDWARQRGASHLVTGHTQDDQAETILMRLSRGSGLAGLAGMRPIVLRAGIRHVRPLLDISKAELVELCRTEGWAFAQDPSNEDDRFARIRWRRLLPVLAEEGLTPARFARLAERAQRAEEALDAKAQEALVRAGWTAEPGLVRLHGAVLSDEPFEIALRVLALALARCREGKQPRLQRMESCAGRLRQALLTKTKVRTSLAGTVIRLDETGELQITLEPQRRRGRYGSVRDDAARAPHSLGKGGRHA